jgi:3-dehydroquinate dehydratase-2
MNTYKLLLVNGPNLNLLGTREPDKYGYKSLHSIETELSAQAFAQGQQLSLFQSNAEHALIDRIHQAQQEGIDFILINPAAFTHTSIALRDALAAVNIPFIEIHLSNVHARESFRKHSYFSDLAVGVLCGFGAQSYSMAFNAAIRWLDDHPNNG